MGRLIKFTTPDTEPDRKSMPMPAPAKAKKRRYLARDDRRSALLDVAAEVVEQQGWPALSMIAVADAAQVSRQLVYQHFESVDELMKDTMTHIFRDVYEGIRARIQSEPGKVMDVVLAAENMTFNLPPNRARALWQILTATTSGQADATRASRRIRHLVSKMWTPTVCMLYRVNEKDGQAMAWMLNMAFWGAHQLVEDGELDQAAASKLFMRLVQNAGKIEATAKPLKKTGAAKTA